MQSAEHKQRTEQVRFLPSSAVFVTERFTLLSYETAWDWNTFLFVGVERDREREPGRIRFGGVHHGHRWRHGQRRGREGWWRKRTGRGNSVFVQFFWTSPMFLNIEKSKRVVFGRSFVSRKGCLYRWRSLWKIWLRRKSLTPTLYTVSTTLEMCAGDGDRVCVCGGDQSDFCILYLTKDNFLRSFIVLLWICFQGSNFVIPVAGFLCRLCNEFYHYEASARHSHCKTRQHFENLKVSQRVTSLLLLLLLLWPCFFFFLP